GAPARGFPQVIQDDRILLGKTEPTLERHDAEHRHPPTLLKNAYAVSKQLGIATELVNHQADYQGTLRGLEQIQGTQQLSEDTSPINVAHQKHRSLDMTSQGHVDNVVIAQVQLDRAAGAFDDDQVMIGTEAVQGGGDNRPELVLVLIIPAGAQGSPRPALDN